MDDEDGPSLYHMDYCGALAKVHEISFYQAIDG